MTYTVENKELIIRNGAEKEVWRGRPEGHDVEWASTVPFSDDGIVLYHYYRPERPYGGFQNLVRVRPDGSIVWRTDLPSSDDKYVYAALRDYRLYATSYGGFEVEIDINTGRIIERRFVK